jgi:deferrochelatase/peroxidase EfeB
MSTSTSGSPDSPSPSRRRFLGGALGVAGVGAAGGIGYGIAQVKDPSPSAAATGTVSLYGTHQAGIATAAQDRLAFAAFDLTTTDPMALQTMLGLWAAAAHQMTIGQPVGGLGSTVDPSAPPLDTGEALGSRPANLTVTVGFGPSMFDQRFGLSDKRPAALAALPAFPGDVLDPNRSNGDIGVQACSDDPQVAFHVVRNFARMARGTAVMRWTQLGFGRTSTTSTAESTPRNLMGFKDGTRNIVAEDTAAMNQHVWVGADNEQPWMQNGSYMVTRRIRMLIESWDTDFLADQEAVFGRTKTSGAPLTGKLEHDVPNLAAKHTNGTPVIGTDAHIRLASPDTNGGVKILRRGYSYTDGIDSDTGLLDAGLFFIAYQADPRKQFVRLQNQLGHHDALNEYIRHTSSAVFAVPGGLSGPGDWFGKKLFAS